MEAVSEDNVEAFDEGVLDEVVEVAVVEDRKERHRVQDEDLVAGGQLDDGGTLLPSERRRHELAVEADQVLEEQEQAIGQRLAGPALPKNLQRNKLAMLRS